MQASSAQNQKSSGQADDEAVKTDGQVLHAVWQYSWVGLIFWAVWALVALMVACRFAGSGTIATAGQIGDLFGGINALFTGLSLAALVYTIILQNRQIKHSLVQFTKSQNVRTRKRRCHERVSFPDWKNSCYVRDGF